MAAVAATSGPRTSVTTTRRRHRELPQTSLLAHCRVGSCSWRRSPPRRLLGAQPAPTHRWSSFKPRSGSGGYVLYSNGMLNAQKGAPFYGDARKSGQNNFATMAQSFWGGYWLINSAGKLFLYGQWMPLRDGHRAARRLSAPSSARLASVKMRAAVAFTR